MADYRIKLSDFFLALTGMFFHHEDDEKTIEYIIKTAPRLIPDNYIPGFALKAMEEIKEIK